MTEPMVSRRTFMAASTAGFATVSAVANEAGAEPADGQVNRRGHQRLPLERLEAWEALGYGMFIHYGMSTFVGQELPSGNDPPETYAPAALDPAQWVAVARDAGMRYAVLTAKHVAGHCLWPSAHAGYTVANSRDTTDVMERFVKACGEYGVLPGFYYCSWDNHNRFGSVTPSDRERTGPPYTTSLYQTFQTAQVTELISRYGPFAEVWIDIPGVLGRGYRTYLYQRIAELQPEAVIMMNSGISTGADYNVDYAWPSDLIAIERNLPPESGHVKWRTIEGKEYCLPGEVCDPIGKEWFFVDGDAPRPDAELLAQFEGCRARGANFLLNVPPDRSGRIPAMHVEALERLRRNAGL